MPFIGDRYSCGRVKTSFGLIPHCQIICEVSLKAKKWFSLILNCLDFLPVWYSRPARESLIRLKPLAFQEVRGVGSV